MNQARWHWTRRDMLRASVVASLGLSSSGWLSALADEVAARPAERRRQCILLWMAGGPSQTDTFDMKPQHANGGEFQEIATRVPGMRFSEHLPMLAMHADQLAIVRSVSTREGDHQRGTYAMRTGRRPGSPIRFPCIGSTLAKELSRADQALPDYFTIDPVVQLNPDAFSPGFLGPRFAPATVGGGGRNDAPLPPGEFAELRVENLTLPNGVSVAQAQARVELWKELQRGFLGEHPTLGTVAQDTVYRRALKIMTSRDTEAFDLSQESDAVRQAYGPTRFGQGCLLARRLIERGVPIVEVTLGEGLGWDTHQDNFRQVRALCQQLDLGWATLMSELKERGLLETTTILWMGEFGRTPNINNMAGRDHFPNAWTCVFAGGGIRGGQYHGSTSEDGTQVVSDPVNEADVLATLCQAMGLDPQRENLSPEGRPHRLAEGTPIANLLA